MRVKQVTKVVDPKLTIATESYQVLPQRFNYTTRLRVLYAKLERLLEEQKDTEYRLLNSTGTGSQISELNMFSLRREYYSRLDKIRKLQDVIVAVNGVPTSDLKTLKELIRRYI